MRDGAHVLKRQFTGAVWKKRGLAWKSTVGLQLVYLAPALKSQTSLIWLQTASYTCDPTLSAQRNYNIYHFCDQATVCGLAKRRGKTRTTVRTIAYRLQTFHEC